MGDFNLRGYQVNVEGTNECMIFRELFEEELLMYQFVTEPTRFNSVLDLVFADHVEISSHFIFQKAGQKITSTAFQTLIRPTLVRLGIHFRKLIGMII